MTQKKFTSLILLAGGLGSRLGIGIPKQFRLLAQKPLICYSLETFADLPEIDEIIIVCEPTFQAHLSSISDQVNNKPLHVTASGPSRQESVYCGLMASSKQADLICIHDAARPFVEKKYIIPLLEKAALCGAAALAIPAVNTIKRADPTGCIHATLPRRELWEVQTPQAIHRQLLLKAYEYAHQKNIEATDDLSLVEAMGEKTYLVEGSSKNFKITTPFDWEVAEKLLCVSN